jgi:hypothetical protein
MANWVGVMSSDSLLRLTMQEVKVNNQKLYSWRNLGAFSSLREKLSSASSWKYIVPFVCICSLIALIEFDIECINIDKGLRDTLIDNRISNVATITSISLVVVGFLINNIKEKNKDTYKLLFSKTNLYAIVYYILSVISVLLFVSLFRDTMTPIQFKNFILVGMVLILVVIVCIGYLFSKIIHFTDPHYLNELFSDNLLISAKRILYSEKISKVSERILSERMSKHSTIIRSTFHMGLPNAVFLEVSNPKTIKDVKIGKLERGLKNLSSQSIADLEFYPIKLGESVYPVLQKKMFSASNQIHQITSLRIFSNNCIKYTKYIGPSESFEEIKSSLFDKSIEAIEQNDLTKINYLLSCYDELYNLYFSSL